MEKLNYRLNGDGPPVVLIHGFCESLKIWGAFDAILSQKYRVLSVDLPGFGDSSLSEADTSIESMAERLKVTLDSVGISEAVFIGHSLGGYVALAFAEHYPEYLKGLGLFHSTAFPDSDERKEKRNHAVELVRQYGGQRYIESLFPSLFSNKSKETMQEQIRYFIKEAAGTSSEAISHTLVAMRDRPDRTAVLQQLDIPVMYVIGKEDLTAPLENSLKECHLPKIAQTYFLDGVGHMGMIEAKDLSLKAVKLFMRFCMR